VQYTPHQPHNGEAGVERGIKARFSGGVEKSRDSEFIKKQNYFFEDRRQFSHIHTYIQ